MMMSGGGDSTASSFVHLAYCLHAGAVGGAAGGGMGEQDRRKQE